LELFKQYKQLFGEERLASDLNLFLNEAHAKGKGVPYLIGIMKNKIADFGQTKIFYDSNS
jgi:hypothetical protein